MSEYINGLLLFLKKYEKWDVDELSGMLGISTKSKSKNYNISKGLIWIYEGKDIAKAKITKHNINIKTIQLSEKGNPKEAMSFPQIDFMEIVGENWYESKFRNHLKKDFLFFVYKNEKDKNFLYKVLSWNIPLEDLDGEIKMVWEDTKKKLQDGNVIKDNGIDSGKNKIITHFLNEKLTNICHVRPHGSNGSDVAALPVADKKTGYNYVLKHSFWFNHAYLKSIVFDKKEEK